MNNFDLTNYDSVADRISEFYKRYPKGLIKTVILSSLEHIQKYVVMEARIWFEKTKEVPIAQDQSQDITLTYGPEDNGFDSMGHAMEIAGQRGANQTSWLENCETSAIGRALANRDIWITRKGASKKEMEKVETANPTNKTKKGSPSEKQIKLIKFKLASDLGLKKEGEQAGWLAEKFSKNWLKLTWRDVNPILVEIQKDKMDGDFNQTSTSVE